MVDRTHYYYLIGDGHVRGRRDSEAPDMIDPQLGQLLQVTVPPTPAAALGVVVRGQTSGAAGIIRRIIGPTTFVLEMIPNAIIPGLGTGAAFAQNNTGPLTGETIAFDNGGTSTVFVTGNSQQLPSNQQFALQMGDARFRTPVPADRSDYVWWDGNAKGCQVISVPVASLAGTAPYLRKGDRCTTPSGAFTVQMVFADPTTIGVAILRKTGTISIGQTITNATIAGGATATISAIGADPQQGTWLPYDPLPNGSGFYTFFERIPNGNGTDGNACTIGPENRLIHAMHAKHMAVPSPNDRGFRLMAFSSYDHEAESDAALGGVTIQVVKCSGTFPTTWQVGEIVTNGTWTSKVHGWNAALKYLFVISPNGETLTAGTIAGANSGSTATCDGAARGWQKGSSHWNAFVAERTKALGSQNALFAGSTAKDEGYVLMAWEAEIGLHSPVIAAPFLLGAAAAAEWVRFIADLRTLSGEETPVVLWKHRVESHQADIFIPTPTGNVPVAFLMHTVLDQLPALISKLTIVGSDDYEMAVGVLPQVGLALRVEDYVDLGERFWRHLAFHSIEVLPGNGFEVLPVGITVGQSQATGFINAGVMMSLDRDPDLWASGQFGAGVSTVDPNALMWNTVTKRIEPFDVAINANGSWNTVQGFCGPEVPVISRMKMRFSESAVHSARYCHFKFTVPGSCLNKNILDATGTWDPELSARPVVTAACTVTVQPATALLPVRGRFTATPGTFDPAVWVPSLSTRLSGSLLGTQGAGGNNSPPYEVQRVYAIAPDGSYIDVQGSFVSEGLRTFTFQAGPPPIWPEFVAQWTAFIAACRDLGVVPRPVFIDFDQVESDLDLLPEYGAALTRFWAALEPLVGLRLKGEEPIAKCLTLLHKQTPWPVPDADVDAARALQLSFAASLGNCVTVEVSDLPLELSGAGTVVRQTRLDNGYHLTARGFIEKGFRKDAALATLGPLKGIPAHPKGELAIGSGAVNGGTDFSSAEQGRVAGGETVSTASGGSSRLAPTSEQLQELTDALYDAPDVAAYTTPSGLSVTRRSVGDMLKLDQAQQAAAARRRGLRQTLVRFD